MVSFPFCKINLGLRIISKRADGYHNIETCFLPVPWTDILEIVPAETLSFSSTGLAIPGRPEENLCLKAYYHLQKQYDLPPVAMHLHKMVPLGAGLGGGSSDASHVLKMLNQIFDIKIANEVLDAVASELGSDCRFFLQDQPMIGTGRGDVLTPANISLQGKFLAIVNPDVHVSTTEAYRTVIPRQPSMTLQSVLSLPLHEWKEKLVNDFEPSVFAIHPQIARIKERLYDLGAEYACMSGSGSSVFGIFAKEVPVAEAFSGTLYWSGEI